MNPQTDRAAWLAARRSGIGASDAAAVLGLSPYGTALGVYLDKTGQLPTSEENAAMRWGLRLEAAIAEAYEEETGVLLEPGELVRHTDFPFLLATPDRVADGDRLVELKTCNAYKADEWGEPGTDQIPEHYLVQVHHQMEVCEFDTADVAVLIGGSDFRIYTVRRNQAIIDALVPALADFWARVVRRDPPPAEWEHPQTAALVEAMYVPDGGTVELEDHESRELAEEYLKCQGAIRGAEAHKAKLKARLIVKMGSAGRALVRGGAVITRKTIQRKGYTVAPTEYRDFRVRVRPPKEEA